MAKIASMQDLYVDELRDLYDAEHQILDALPKMAEAASSPKLKSAFQEHERQTRGQVQRLDRIFEKMGSNPKGKKCQGIAGVISEGKDLLKEKVDADVLDAGLIASAQKVEHYEIAGYGTVRTYARMLGDNDAVRLLQETLDEEGETDKKLTAIAEERVNPKAVHAS